MLSRNINIAPALDVGVILPAMLEFVGFGVFLLVDGVAYVFLNH